MRSLPQKFVLRLLRSRIAVVATYSLALLSALATLPGLTVSNSMSTWFPEQGRALQDYRDFRQTFGSDEIVIVAVSGEKSFVDDAGSEIVFGLTQQMLDIPGVAIVTSRSTVPQSSEIAQDRLLSEDGLTTVLLVQLLDDAEIEADRQRILRDIDGAAAEFDLVARLAGFGVIYAALNEASTSGSVAILLAAHVLMFIVLLSFLRRLWLALLVLLTVSVASVVTLAIFVAAGEQLNMITMALPTLVLVIGIADCVHLIRSVSRQPARQDRRTRLAAGTAAVAGPAIFATVTTAAGFLVLALSDIEAIRSLGIFAAIGMLLAFACAFSLLPVLLSWCRPIPIVRPDPATILARRMCKFAQRRPAAVVAVSLALILSASFGVARLDVDTYSIGYLDRSHRVRQDSDFIEAEIGPYAPLDFVINSTGDVLQPATLDALYDWQRRVTQESDVAWSWSLLDTLGAPVDRPPSSMPAGWAERKLERLNRFAPVVASSMIAGKHQLRVTFGTQMMSAKKLRRLISDISSRADFPEGVEVEPAGYGPLYAEIVEVLVESQVESFSLAGLLVLLLLALATRSVKRLLLAVPANLLPVLLTLGLMGLVGIPLDVATITIAGILFGLVVDDTVHLLYPTGDQARPLCDSLKGAVRLRGGSLFVTTAVLAAGFLVFGLAGVRSVAWFGLLISFALISALVADLMLLPAIARLGRAGSRRAAAGGPVQ